MLASVYTSALQGFTSYSVNIEAQAKNGDKGFFIIGLGDNAVKEARDRIKSAVAHSGLKPPPTILVNLAPAEIKKEGSSFDLGIAVSILAASGQISAANLDSHTAYYGELSLNGAIRSVRGIIALLLEALDCGIKCAIVPKENLNEAVLVKGISIIPVTHLIEVVNYLKNGQVPDYTPDLYRTDRVINIKDFSDVSGQIVAKKALAIAAAGGHNLLMIGPPGCGKSMLAERLPSLLPPLSDRETQETVRIHSILGQPILGLLSGQRPYRSPHHGISEAGLIGGGSPPKPGEISLAHRGILFLDEFPEFKRTALESMRAPLESGRVRVTRAKASYEFPARFQLLAAMNPCPCGRLGVNGISCLCSITAIQNYLKRLSQPILDRIDIHLDLSPVPIYEITASAKVDKSAEVQKLKNQVITAREMAIRRYKMPNAVLSNKQIESSLLAEPKALEQLQKLEKKEALSARAFFRILKVARTIADLEQSETVHQKHLAEAVNFRGLDLIQKYTGLR